MINRTSINIRGDFNLSDDKLKRFYDNLEKGSVIEINIKAFVQSMSRKVDNEQLFQDIEIDLQAGQLDF